MTCSDPPGWSGRRLARRKGPPRHGWPLHTWRPPDARSRHRPGPHGRPARRVPESAPAVRRPRPVRLRHIACPDTRADLVAETLAISLEAVRRLHRRGKDPGSSSRRWPCGVRRRCGPAAGWPGPRAPATSCRRSRGAARVRRRAAAAPAMRCPHLPRRWPTTPGRRCRSRRRSGSTSRGGGPGSARGPGRSSTRWPSASGPGTWPAGSGSAGRVSQLRRAFATNWRGSTRAENGD